MANQSAKINLDEHLVLKKRPEILNYHSSDGPSVFPYLYSDELLHEVPFFAQVRLTRIIRL